ncbi:hypothetical protein GB937_006025 [Aspergillus fischeri]|nr:hypothetical protein GB937_006025 [Aspergillus fischeri]
MRRIPSDTCLASEPVLGVNYMDDLEQKMKLDKDDHFWNTPQQRRMAVIISDACNYTARYKNPRWIWTTSMERGQQHGRSLSRELSPNLKGGTKDHIRSSGE